MTPETDAKLSALLDGELAPDEAAALREEIARRPELAARLSGLAEVDEGLRALPARPVPAQLRARLAERIRAEAGAAPRGAQSRAAGARHAPGRARRRWLVAAALATAAALALVVLPRLWSGEAQLAGTLPGSAVEPEPLPDDLLGPDEEPAAADVAMTEDLPVIEVLDVLAELDELEGNGSG